MISKKDLFTIPNLLSLLRLILIPVYTSIYLGSDRNLLAAGILTFSCITDLLDGYIARRFQMVSDLGKFLDPLADKITQLSVLLCLATRYLLLRALIPLFVIKEILQCTLAYLHFRNGKTLNGALFAGKISTAVLFISLILLMAMPTISISHLKTLVITDAVFLIISLASYLSAYLVDTGKLCDT